MELLKSTIADIRPLDEQVMREARARLDNLVKPIGSLGRLEDIAARLAGITGRLHNDMAKRAIIIMAADNGVVAEGVAAADQAVTAIMTQNFLKGVTGVAVLAKEARADLRVVDIGVKADLEAPGLINRKIAYGTANFAVEPAMSYDDAVKAVEIGIEVANDTIDQGYDIIGTGEMGIGNTSSSSCVLVVLGDVTIDVAVGKGAGLTEDAHTHKKQVLQRTIDLHAPAKSDPLDVVAKVGGFDIAGLAGVYLACAARRVPVVVDGFISAAAALVAISLAPAAREFMFASHCSAEPGFMAMMRAIDMEPILNLDMRLGEGSGCPLAFHVIDGATTIMNDMATFAEATVDSTNLVDIRE